MDVEKLKKIVSEYRIPLIFIGIGIVILLLAILLFVKTQSVSEPVEFVQKDASSSAQLQKVRVDVEGAVVSAGVYELAEGSRIYDALASAGGLSKNADLDWISKNLNKAAKLVDGGKIYIPSNIETIEGKGQSSNIKSQKSGEKLLGVTTGFININSASQSELEGLPGVGPVTASKIIEGRPYATIDELKTKKAVGNALFEKIKDKLTI